MIKHAAELLGLNVIRIISEQKAAVLAYEFKKKYLENKKILVFHLGGATFDASI